MTFRQAADAVRERLPGFAIPYDVPRNAVAHTYKALMSQFMFPETYTETTLTWTANAREMATTTITDWRGRGVVLSGGTADGTIEGTWIQLDVPSVLRRRVLYDGGDLNQAYCDGRFVFGIWGSGRSLHTVAPISVESTITVGHFKTHELDDDDDVLLMNVDYEEMVISGALLKVWDYINRYAPTIVNRYPPDVQVAQAYYNKKLAELQDALDMPANISFEIPRDPLFSGVNEMRRDRKNW
ncbi:MAG TPA: hypothetical protein PLG27_09515 [Candidatus Latescibacteria bacterium]|jgi:hypothetical protein|nr:hypothetical protein [Candidatus Latescibacterota bacterium]